MEIKVSLIGIMDHLNAIGSKVFIEYYDEKSGTIFLSNNQSCCIAELINAKYIEDYIGV